MTLLQQELVKVQVKFPEARIVKDKIIIPLDTDKWITGKETGNSYEPMVWNYNKCSINCIDLKDAYRSYKLLNK